MSESTEIVPYLVAGAAGIGGGLVLGSLYDELKDRMRRQIWKPMFDNWNESLHERFIGNLDLTRELIGEPRAYNQVLGGSRYVAQEAHPDDLDAANSLKNFFTPVEVRAEENPDPIALKQPSMIFGGPTGNWITRRIFGYYGHPEYLHDFGEIQTPFRSLSNIEKYPETRVKLKRYLPNETKDVRDGYSMIWRYRGKKNIPDIQISGDQDGFEAFDMLKLTKIRNHIVIDGLSGLGTRAVGLLFSTRKALKDAVEDLQKQIFIPLPHASYEAIFYIKVEHDHASRISKPVGIEFKYSEAIGAGLG